MLSSAIVVFREVFEIVLIVGIVLAATREMPHRAKAVLLGFGGGLAGSALVALFTGAISGFAQGLGQEYFNAAILFTAAGFIGWTLLWMKRHAKEMRQNFEKIGKEMRAAIEEQLAKMPTVKPGSKASSRPSTRKTKQV